MTTLDFVLITLLIIAIVFAIYFAFKNKKQMEINSSIQHQYLQSQQQANLQIEKNRLLESNLNKQSSEAKQQLQDFLQRSDKEKSQLNDELRLILSKNTDLEKRLENAIVSFKNQQEKLDTQNKEIEQLQEKFKLEFENIANKLLEEKSQKFTEQNKFNIDNILNPLKEKIKAFEDKVEKTYQTESNERASLKTQIEQLTLLNQKLNGEAANLTKALKGDNKTQGNWGEMILARVLEYSGLTKGIEYTTQSQFITEDGSKLVPDVTINLPEEKYLIIDSKVSIVAYENYTSSTDDATKEDFLKKHVDSVKSHIKELSSKKYYTVNGQNSPEFVLLFMPIESAFVTAIQADLELFNFAWDRKIVLVSPSTLLATLRTVASTWKLDKQNRNAEEITKEVSSMLDKLAGFVEDLDDIGKNISKSQEAYTEARKKLFTGKGNLLSKVEKIEKLGVKSEKLKLSELTESNDHK